MRLFGRTSEESVSRRVAEASALCEQGRVAQGRKRLEKLVEEAEEGLGADNRETLFGREALAMSYTYDTPQRALRLIEQLVPEYERIFGNGSRELLILRGHLPGLHGVNGEHEVARDLAVALVPECERVFSSDAQRTREMRQNVRFAEEQIAQTELERLLAITSAAEPEAGATKRATELARRAADRFESASSYRSLLLLQSVEGQGTDRIQWQFEYVRPEKLHVLQIAQEEGAQLEDEWIVLGAERYQNAGLWFKADNDANAKIDQFLLTDKCLELLRTWDPTATRMVDSTDRNYLALEYDRTSQAFTEFVSSEERQLEQTTGFTRVWIDTSTDTLARVDIVLAAQPENEEGVELHLEGAQAYTNYDAKIEIEAPELQVTPP